MVDYNERRPIKGFSEYEIDRMGNIYFLGRFIDTTRNGSRYTRNVESHPIKSSQDYCGYLAVGLKGDDGKWHTRRVHRLVAEAFIPNPNELPYINHKDENRMNPCVDNLEWCTPSYNYTYGTGQVRIDKTKKPVWGKKVEEDEWVLYSSMGEATKILNVGSGSVSNVCSGRQKTAHGYVFKLFEE